MDDSGTRGVGPATTRSYQPVAWCYDRVAALYSLGRIARAGAWQLQWLAPGDRVLYAGIGGGAAAVGAAQRGARVTGLDVAPAMLRRAARRFEGAGQPVELLEGDLFRQPAEGRYDVVALNFFLNVFGHDEMERALACALGLLVPGGRVLLADFAPLPEAPAARLAASLYYWPVDLIGAALGLAALHPPYDYAPSLARLGYTVTRRAGFALAPGLAPSYEALLAAPSA